MQEEKALVIVEWANNILSEMPEDTLYVEIKYNDELSRKVSTYRIENGELEYVDIWNNNNN
jgi:tRNA threonylcarbamoyladenosine biosynthesis protein TsaE